MKKMLLMLLCGSFLGANAQVTYNGNARTGFGGVVGNGSIVINDDGTDVTFNFNRPVGPAFNDILVIYIDSKSGGFTNTATLNDQEDGGRQAVSGVGGDGRSTVNFPSGFAADYGIAWGNFGFVLFELAAGGNNSLIFKSFVGNQNTATVPKTDLGITGPVTFRLVGTYTAPSGYRSNELLVEDIGNGTADANGNFGTNPITLTQSFGYPASVLSTRLERFSGLRVASGVQLQWQVTCTGRFARFELQRSTDGQHFETVHAQTETAERCRYPFDFTDKLAGSGRLLYRLKVTSDAGQTSYSGVAIIKAAGQRLLPVEANVYPTLVSGQAQLMLSLAQPGQVSLRMVNTQGAVVSSQQINGLAGTQALTLPVQTLAAGVYTIQVWQAGQQPVVTRFVKQ